MFNIYCLTYFSGTGSVILIFLEVLIFFLRTQVFHSESKVDPKVSKVTMDEGRNALKGMSGDQAGEDSLTKDLIGDGGADAKLIVGQNVVILPFKYVKNKKSNANRQNVCQLMYRISRRSAFPLYVFFKARE